MNRSDAHHIRDLIFQAHQKHGDDTAAMARELRSIRAYCKSLEELAEIWAWEEAKKR